MDKYLKVFQRCGEVFFNMFITHVPSHAVRRGYLKLWGATIGPKTYILRGTSILAIDKLVIGEHSNVGFRCMLDARGGLTIGDRVVIASDTHFISGRHLMNEPGFDIELLPIVVEDYVWITSRVTVLLDVTIGRGAVIASNACVTSDVEPLTVAAGIPAKPIGQRKESALEYDPAWFPLFY